MYKNTDLQYKLENQITFSFIHFQNLTNNDSFLCIIQYKHSFSPLLLHSLHRWRCNTRLWTSLREHRDAFEKRRLTQDFSRARNPVLIISLLSGGWERAQIGASLLIISNERLTGNSDCVCVREKWPLPPLFFLPEALGRLICAVLSSSSEALGKTAYHHQNRPQIVW